MFQRPALNFGDVQEAMAAMIARAAQQPALGVEFTPSPPYHCYVK